MRNGLIRQEDIFEKIIRLCLHQISFIDSICVGYSSYFKRMCCFEQAGFTIYLTKGDIAPGQKPALRHVDMADQPIINMNDIYHL